jgi:hypothetical protein
LTHAVIVVVVVVAAAAVVVVIIISVTYAQVRFDHMTKLIPYAVELQAVSNRCKVIRSFACNSATVGHLIPSSYIGV